MFMWLTWIRINEWVWEVIGVGGCMNNFLSDNVGFWLHENMDIIGTVSNQIMNIVCCGIISGCRIFFQCGSSPFIEDDIFADSYLPGCLVPEAICLLGGAVSDEGADNAFGVQFLPLSFWHVNVGGGSKDA